MNAECDQDDTQAKEIVRPVITNQSQKISAIVDFLIACDLTQCRSSPFATHCSRCNPGSAQ